MYDYNMFGCVALPEQMVHLLIHPIQEQYIALIFFMLYENLLDTVCLFIII